MLPLTGRKIQIETDLTSGSVAFSRVYSSIGWHLPYSIEGRLPPFLGKFGHYWRTKFDCRVYNLNSVESEIGISFPNGAFQYFDSDLQPIRGDDKAGVLRRIDDTLHYRYEGKHLVFSSEGLLKEYHQSGRPGLVLRYSGHGYSGPTPSVDAQGNATTVALPEGFLVAIENSQTQRVVFEFSYDAGGRIVVAKTPSETVLYGYDAQDNLVSVEKEEGGTRTYVYDDPRFPNFLTGLIDESGELFAQWHYDAGDRAVSSEHAEGTEKYELDFTFISDAADPRVLVKNPMGKGTTYHYETIDGVRKVNRLEGHASSNCAVANKSYGYYDNGTLKSKTDWEGNVTTYLRDDWGREIARTEAAGTPGARTITTEYHSEFNKPVKITEPGLVTGTTYDSADRLLSTKKTSTTVQ